MPRRKTNEEFTEEINDLVGTDYTFLEEYKGGTTKIDVKHNVCGTIYPVEPKAFLQGNRCIECNPYRRKTTEEFKKEVYKLVNDTYSVESEYIGHHKSVIMKHRECDEPYPVAPSDFLKGRRCKRCYFNSKMKTNEEWLAQVRELTAEEYIFLETYKGDNKKLKYKHSCGGVHHVTPNNFINGTRCTICKESIGEANIRRVLEEYNVQFTCQKSFDGLIYVKPLTYDFYLLGMNIAIEYQGIQHYEPVDYFGGLPSFEKQLIKDKIKLNYATSNGITLVEVPYTYDSYEKIKCLLDTTIFSKR